MKSLHIIKQEHRNLYRVVSVLDHLVQERSDGQKPDFGLMEDILDYIESFTDKYHHPKEDEYLFRALRRRDPGAHAIIEELEDEHRNCPASLGRMRAALRAYKDAWPDANPHGGGALRDLTATYLRFQTKHLQKEEGVVLPLAQRALTEDDWRAIDAAFADNDDPVFGPEGRAETRRMYSRIVQEAPAPFGFGE